MHCDLVGYISHCLLYMSHVALAFHILKLIKNKFEMKKKHTQKTNLSQLSGSWSCKKIMAWCGE